ncbi:MAG: hypothetical protein HS126_07720 [Anaerolineales bacterium]|nr:hypothetical protein [Anaerolineales bacterium]
MPVRQFVSELITQAKRAAPQQLDRLVAQVSSAPFADDLLEVDEPLWGGFWQGDVIAPGYSLPAVELALLRAIRLDGTWPEGTSVAQFLAGLHQAISSPHAGVWVLAAAGEPCVIFASLRGQTLGIGGQPSAVGGQPLATVVWYCAATERLHAGYRTPLETFNFSESVEQRSLDFLVTPPFEGASHQINQASWLEQAAEPAKIGGGQPSTVGGPGLAARLDAEILRLRFTSSK